MTPYLDDLARAQVQSVSPRRATVFEGYCLEHESEFHQFEQQKRLSTIEHVALQLKRSAARENMVWESRWAATQDALRLFEDILSVLPVEPDERDRWKAQVHEPLDYYGHHALLRLDHVSFVHEDVVELIDAGTPSLPRWIRWFHHDAVYPVAVSGCGDVLIGGRLVPIVFVSIPNGESGLTILGTTKDDEWAIELFAVLFASDKEMRESLVLEWMAYTDHWVANPAWWHALPDKVCDQIRGALDLSSDRATFMTKITENLQSIRASGHH